MKLAHLGIVSAIMVSVFIAAVTVGPLAEAQSFLVPKKETGQETTGGYRGVIAPRPVQEGEELKQQATRPKYRIKQHVARRDAEVADQPYRGMKTTKEIQRLYQTQTGLSETVQKGHISRGQQRLDDIERLQKMGFNVRSHVPRPASMTAEQKQAYIAEVKKEREQIKRLRGALRKIDEIVENQSY